MERVLIITDLSIRRQIRVSNVSRALSEAGCQVRCLCLDPETKSSAGELETVGNIEVRHLKVGRIGAKAVAISADFSLYGRLISGAIAKEILDFRPDILHVYNIYVWPGVERAIKRIRPKIIVLDIAENLPEIIQEYAFSQKGLGRALISHRRWVALEERAVAEANRLIFVTEEAASECRSRVGFKAEKSIVLSNYIWPDDLGARESHELERRFDGQFVLLYFGDTALRRGMESLIKGFSLAADKYDNLQLVLVGHSKKEQHVLARLKSVLPHGNRIHLEGFQPLNTLGGYLNVSEVGVCPILRNTHHDTTHANKLFQYLNAGLALLVSDCPSQAALVQATGSGLVHRANDPKSIAREILKLRASTAQLEAFQLNALSSISMGNNWPDAIQLYLKSTRALLPQKKP